MDRQKIKVDRLGKTIVERDGDDILVCLPDGQIEFAASAKDARAIHDKWQNARTTSVGVCEIEWRGFRRDEIPS